MQKNMRYLCLWLCFWLCFWLCLSFKWPDGNVLLTEFAGNDSILPHPEPASYIVFEGGNSPRRMGENCCFRDGFRIALAMFSFFMMGMG